MKDNEYAVLIFVSVMLAMIQSFFVRGFFEYYGYIIWFFILVTYLYSLHKDGRILNQTGSAE